MENYKVLVIGLGNVLKSDDGLGPTVVKKLNQQNWQREILIVDGGSCPLAYLEQLSVSQSVIIIDAIKNGHPAGTIYQFDLEKFNNHRHQHPDLHSYSITQVIALAREINNLPEEVTCFGIEPNNLDWGTEFSHPVRAAMPQLIREVQKQINIFSKK